MSRMFLDRTRLELGVWCIRAMYNAGSNCVADTLGGYQRASVYFRRLLSVPARKAYISLQIQPSRF